MPQGVTRELGRSTSQSVTYESVGQAEDYDKILHNIDPTSTPIFSRLNEGPRATETDVGWFYEHLEPPGVNAHLEVEEYEFPKVGSVSGGKNYVQNFQNAGMISDTQKSVKMMYNTPEGDLMAHAMTQAFTKQARDIEYALLNNSTANAGDANTAPLMGGIPYFMDLATISVTVDSSTGVVTASEAHGLKTGDFVYFVATKIPAGMTSGVMYYVHLDETNPTTAFTIYDRPKDAIEVGPGAASQVIPTDAGNTVSIIRTNVKSLSNEAQFTLDDIDDVMAMAATRGGKPTDAYMNMENKRRFSKLVSALAHTQRAPKDRYGSEVADTYETDGGIISAHSHLFHDPSRIDILDFDYWDLRYLRKPHEVQNLGKTGTYDKFVLETSLTLQASQPKASAAIIDISRS